MKQWYKHRIKYKHQVLDIQNDYLCVWDLCYIVLLYYLCHVNLLFHRYNISTQLLL